MTNVNQHSNCQQKAIELIKERHPLAEKVAEGRCADFDSVRELLWFRLAVAEEIESIGGPTEVPPSGR